MQIDRVKQFEHLSRIFPSLIPLNGKAPVEREWQRWCTEPRPFSPKDFRNGQNAGIPCGPSNGVIVVDVDDIEKFNAVVKEKGWKLPYTRMHETGTGKSHYLYQYPKNGKRYGCRAFKESGFDIRGIGGQVVAPGSVHPDTGKPYEVRHGEAEIAPPPEWLLELALQQEEPKHEVQPQPAQEWDCSIDPLPVSDEIKKLIRGGKPKGERSEAIMSVINALVAVEVPDETIFSIFETCPIGEKYREKGQSKVKWLQVQIKKAEKYVAENPRQNNHPLSDLGNAERLVEQHANDLRYCYPYGKWLLFDGMRWKVDDTGEIYRRAKGTVRNMYKEASIIEGKEAIKEFVRHIVRYEQDARIKAMVSLAESESGIPVLPEDLDTDRWLFNCRNGTLNLKTGEFYPHRREDLITKLAPVKFDPGEHCPQWMAHLQLVMDGNEEVIMFLQRG